MQQLEDLGTIDTRVGIETNRIAVGFQAKTLRIGSAASMTTSANAILMAWLWCARRRVCAKVISNPKLNEVSGPDSPSGGPQSEH